MENHLISDYYQRFFPSDTICRWLMYGNDPETNDPHTPSDFLQRREFSFTLPGDIYTRYLTFDSAPKLVEELMRQRPEKIDIGAVWTLNPRNRSLKSNNDRFEPVEREFVIDIDMDEYDNVRTCCKGATLCLLCWKFMSTACKAIKFALEYAYGFRQFLWVFSGRRGIHCWVCDAQARRLNNFKRKSVVEFLNSGPRNHSPFVQICEQVLAPAFDEIIVRDQRLLDIDEHLNTMRSLIPQESATPQLLEEFAKIRNYLQTSPEYQPLEAISNLLQEPFRTNYRRAVVHKFLFPRLDVHVSMDTGHLLKAPFSIHPKTGKVCVPFLAENVDTFDPAEVPTLEGLLSGSCDLVEHVQLLEDFVSMTRENAAADRKDRMEMIRQLQSASLSF